METLLSMQGIRKTFPGVVANDQVNLEVKKGEIHTLLGENGAGKTTLMNTLYGLYQPDSGRVLYKGEEVSIRNPADAIALGIGMVHQHFMLVPYLRVVENMVLGMKSEREPLLNLKKSAKQINKLADSYSMKIDPWAYVWQLSVGQEQRVEILKALYRGAELLILDEPTAVLTPQEVEELFHTLKRLTEEGLTIIFISHKLNEVLRISDRISVLRGGRMIETLEAPQTDARELARLMVGREVLFRVEKDEHPAGNPVLQVDHLSVKNDKGLNAVNGFSCEVKEGEILGIAGVDGNGQSELIEAIAGLRKLESGSIRLMGNEISGYHPRKIIEQGLSHIPEDRQSQGLVMDMTVEENSYLQDFYCSPFSKGIFLDPGYIKEHSDNLVDSYDVRCPDCQSLVRNLSGGNQQKLVLGRELSRNPKALLAMHPTRGLDVGAIEYVHKKMVEERDKGCAILLVSTELDEILFLSDRILVIYEGEVMGEFENKDDLDVSQIGLMMAGKVHE